MTRQTLTCRPGARFPEYIDRPLPAVALGRVLEESRLRNGAKLPPSSVMGVRKTGGIVPMDERLTASDISRYKILRQAWFAYNPMRLNIGSIARWQGSEDVLVSPDYVVFRCLDDVEEEDRITPQYFDHLRRTEQWSAYVNRAGDGGVRVRIYFDDIAELRVCLPELDEQRKIADCLDALADLLALEADRLKTLHAHKHGLAQQILPRPGQSQPLVRFPDFRQASAWHEVKLGLMTGKVGSGVTPKGGDKNYRPDGRPFIRSQNVGWGELLLEDVAYIDEDTHAGFTASELATGDVLLNITGASIGRSVVADDRIAGGNVNQHVCIIRAKPQVLHPGFLSQYLLSAHGQAQIDSAQAGGNRQGLNFAQIRGFLIPTPGTVEEQAKVADCLKSADALIADQASRVEALRTHQRGLMQKLFCTPQEAAR